MLVLITAWCLCADGAGSIASFSQVSPLASMLLVPTQIWVTIAAKLNYDIVKLNTTNAKVGKVQ